MATMRVWYVRAYIIANLLMQVMHARKGGDLIWHLHFMTFQQRLVILYRAFLCLTRLYAPSLSIILEHATFIF